MKSFGENTRRVRARNDGTAGVNCHIECDWRGLLPLAPPDEVNLS
jgi:hypothetical protein